MAPKNFIQKRLFVFDSFEDGNLIDLSESKANPGELVAFPPTENMDLHLNVVVQDLAVSTFMVRTFIKAMHTIQNTSYMCKICIVKTND